MEKPVRLEKLDEYQLAVDWSDGERRVYPTLALRAACPCARCVDEMTGEKKITVSDLPADIRPSQIRPVGSYALSIEWSDGHNTGIYTFEHLKRLGTLA